MVTATAMVKRKNNARSTNRELFVDNSRFLRETGRAATNSVAAGDDAHDCGCLCSIYNHRTFGNEAMCKWTF